MSKEEKSMSVVAAEIVLETIKTIDKLAKEHNLDEVDLADSVQHGIKGIAVTELPE